ncbi:pre-mRNA polyadenylation factor FIP1 [Folsomia candida]|uniref:pre-mRNA polyadenylation factor FIP1 n=1 Tax=Folsomia candida TaxID=158441 RepID=UPI000B9036B8|nr:pre-mRNA polyadenylation factor FIP1 [Folsomia candida]
MSSEEVREDDEWLYEGGRGGGGEADNDTATLAKGENGEEDGDDDDDEHVGTPVAIDGQENGEEGTNTGAMNDGDSDEDDDDDDDDDDGVQVVIGDTKPSAAAAGQTPFGGTGVGVAGVKRPAPAPDKKGKFAVEDFETPGTINGNLALEFSIDGLEEKPWRKPGADITDYFNYGFTEDTWRAYTDRQKRMRFESGGPQIINPVGPKPVDSRGVISVAFGGPSNNNQVQSQRMENMNNMMNMRRREEPRENTIQVMTADRREYSRKNFEMGIGGPSMPPTFNPTIPPPNFPPPGHGPPGPEFINPEFFNHPPPQYYPDEHQGYEEQWMDHHTDSWDMGSGHPQGGSSAIVSLTKVPNVPPPPGDDDIKHERKD